MKKEEQYRYCLFPQADPIPTWVKEAVSYALSDHDAQPDAVIAATENLIRRLHANALANLRAHELLGWSTDSGNQGLLQHTEQLVNNDPENAANYWCAMWTIRHNHDDEAALEQSLPAYADALEEQAVHREQGWPRTWATALAETWTKAEGTNASARAWARAGWKPEDVLLMPSIKLDGRALSLKERVTTLRVPLRDDAQYPHVYVTRHTCGQPLTRGTR